MTSPSQIDNTLLYKIIKMFDVIKHYRHLRLVFLCRFYYTVVMAFYVRHCCVHVLLLYFSYETIWKC